MIEIRRATADELPSWLATMAFVFHETFDPAKNAEAVRELYDFDRVWGAWEGSRPVGTLRGSGTWLTVPGGAQVPATGLSGVTVMPTHRRGGILTRMIGAEHAAARERGEVASALYASEAPIYGRFGYGAAVQSGEWTIDTLAARVRGEPSGTVEWADPAVARDDVLRIYDAHRARQVGELHRKSFRFDYALGLREWPDEPPWRGRLLLHRDATGSPDGYARYVAKEEWRHGMPRYTVEVQDLHTANDAAWVDLWRYLVGMDFVSTIKADHRAVHEPLPWILENGRHAVLSGAGDGLYVCLLDLTAALAARSYDHEDALVLEVAGGPWGQDARERVRLDAGPAGAMVTATEASPDLTLRASALAAAYLGGGPLGSVVLGGGADEHTAGALARASRLFATIDQPWCSTFF